MVTGFLISLAGIGLWHITDRYEKRSWVIKALYRTMMVAGMVVTVSSIAI